MERGRGNGLFALLIVLGLGAAAGGVWYRRHIQTRTMVQNENEASAALKMLCAAEADFRYNDRDANGVKDFWTGDVAGLFTVLDKDGIQIRLIFPGLAEADASPVRPATAHAVPFHGYNFMALDADESNPDAAEQLYRQDTGGKPPSGKVHHHQAFGFCAYPYVPGETGRYVYIVNENNTIFRSAMTGAPPTTWPADQEIMKHWSKTNW